MIIVIGLHVPAVRTDASGQLAVMHEYQYQLHYFLHGHFLLCLYVNDVEYINDLNGVRNQGKLIL